MSVIDMLRLPFYHPVLEEGVENALYDLLGKMDGPDEMLSGGLPSDSLVEIEFADGQQ